MHDVKVVIQPFCSQQNKGTKRFLLDADVTTQISRFLAESLGAAGAEVRLLLPEPTQCVYPEWTKEFEITSTFTPTENRDRRLAFDPIGMRSALADRDLFITHNELVTFKARQVASKNLKIIHFNHLLPLGEWQWMEPLQVASWSAADLAVFLAPHLKAFAQTIANAHNDQSAKMVVWPMVYDEHHIMHREVLSEGTVDLLFVQRCSSNNYTHHKEFIEALRILRHQYNWNGQVVFTDPTQYLELHGSAESATQFDDLGIRFARCSTRQSYYRLLANCKVAVAMMAQDLHGGVAIREAIASGCLPVLLDDTCYHSLLGDQARNWPYLVPQPIQPPQLARMLFHAVTLHRDGGEVNQTLSELRERLRKESYQAAWQSVVEQDITNLLGR